MRHKDLTALRVSNDRVQAELERIEHLKGGVKWAGRVLELNHVLETLTGNIERVSRLPAIAMAPRRAA